jgi:predicted MFS family arabinose efflux permease
MGAVLWMSQAGYLSLSAPPEKLPFYIGIFFALNQSSQITANLLSLFALGEVSQFHYFIILFCIALFFSFLFVMIPSVEKPIKKKFTVKENLAKIKELMKKSRIQILSVYFTSTGVCIGFYTGYLYLLIEESLESGLSRSEVNVKTSYVFILLGVCSFFAGLICGKLAGKVSLNRLMMMSIIFLEASIIASMFAFYTKSYALCFISGGLWGFTDSFFTTLTNILVKIECGNGLEGYVILRFCMGIGFLVTCVLSMGLSGHSNYAFLLIIFILQMISMGVVLELKS